MDESQKKQAMITSLRLLAATPKSRRHLAERLGEKGYPESVVRETLDALEKQGVLNDRNLAEGLKSRFLFAQPSGNRKISFELKRKGIPAKIRQEILEKLGPEEEKARAYDIGLTRWQKFEKLPALKRKKKVYDFLVRRGFDFQIVHDLIEEFGRLGSDADR